MVFKTGFGNIDLRDFVENMKIHGFPCVARLSLLQNGCQKSTGGGYGEKQNTFSETINLETPKHLESLTPQP